MQGTGGTDVLSGPGGLGAGSPYQSDVTLHGGDVDDTLTGGIGNDTIDGGGDTDMIDASRQRRHRRRPGNDTIDGGAGNDELTAAPASTA